MKVTDKTREAVRALIAGRALMNRANGMPAHAAWATAALEVPWPLTLKEVAEILGVSRDAVYNMVDSKRLPVLFQTKGLRGAKFFDAAVVEKFRLDRAFHRRGWRPALPDVPEGPRILDIEGIAQAVRRSSPGHRAARRVLALIAETRHLRRLIAIASGFAEAPETTLVDQTRRGRVRKWNRGEPDFARRFDAQASRRPLCAMTAALSRGPMS